MIRFVGFALCCAMGAGFCVAGDGITLLLSRGDTPFSARLEWSGGQPDFQIYRDATPTGVSDVVNLAALTSDSQWNESSARPPSGTGFYYLVTEGDLVAGVFPEMWINGESCASEPVIQVHQYNADLYILRQSMCTNFEGPFIYLLFGEDRVLMEDTGAGGIPIAQAVYDVIDQWLSDNGKTSIELIVAHSHAHGDHVQGDSQFQGQPNTTVVGLSPTAVATFFGISNWPEQVVSYDLGGRILDVVPIPGHQAAHVALYDRQTSLLLTGDTLYAGRCYISNFPAYVTSLERLVGFISDKPVVNVLGTHIEMTNTPFEDFPFGSTVHIDEHPLELRREHLLELRDGVVAMADAPFIEAHREFFIWPF